MMDESDHYESLGEPEEEDYMEAEACFCESCRKDIATCEDSQGRYVCVNCLIGIEGLTDERELYAGVRA